MDISDPVVVEGMQNMQIHQSGKQLLKISEIQKLLVRLEKCQNCIT